MGVESEEKVFDKPIFEEKVDRLKILSGQCVPSDGWVGAGC